MIHLYDHDANEVAEVLSLRFETCRISRLEIPEGSGASKRRFRRRRRPPGPSAGGAGQCQPTPCAGASLSGLLLLPEVSFPQRGRREASLFMASPDLAADRAPERGEPAHGSRRGQGRVAVGGGLREGWSPRAQIATSVGPCPRRFRGTREVPETDPLPTLLLAGAGAGEPELRWAVGGVVEGGLRAQTDAR